LYNTGAEPIQCKVFNMSSLQSNNNKMILLI